LPAWQPWLAMVDADGKWVGMVSAEHLNGGANVQQALRPDHAAVAAGTGLRELLPQLMRQGGPLAVLDDDGAYLGVITAASALRKLSFGAHHAA
jgi:CBS-domain-containing membrane protein